MTNTAKPSSHRERDHAILAAGGYTGWWDEHGVPAPWPDDFFNPDTDWRPDSPLVTPEPDEHPF